MRNVLRMNTTKPASEAALAAVANALEERPFVPVDLDEQAELRREVALGMKPAATDYAPQPQSEPPKLTGVACGEAIVQEFENTANEIEALGRELREAQAKAEERQRVLATALEDLTATTKAYREEAQRVSDEVERVTAMATSVSELCADMRAKLKAQKAASE